MGSRPSGSAQRTAGRGPIRRAPREPGPTRSSDPRRKLLTTRGHGGCCQGPTGGSVGGRDEGFGPRPAWPANWIDDRLESAGQEPTRPDPRGPERARASRRASRSASALACCLAIGDDVTTGAGRSGGPPTAPTLSVQPVPSQKRCSPRPAGSVPGCSIPVHWDGTCPRSSVRGSVLRVTGRPTARTGPYAPYGHDRQPVQTPAGRGHESETPRSRVTRSREPRSARRRRSCCCWRTAERT